ncbi:unknown (plasmid) [Haloarcula marismortui ATCC 43049]|uniref:DUF7718 domain-containing protein n=1 Tax=Haloarcula marismortui (strain ATCC 43049 / DSM 3752 / JCM 8966 / VKM B-1809) TaxID=272569 RepID=Q5V7Y7_HALMA|nr:unknown [Haloarcula marismortui ATCC 43049]
MLCYLIAVSMRDFLPTPLKPVFRESVQETDYVNDFDLPYVRLRVHIETANGDVEKFTIQLEYNVALVGPGKNDWGPLARFDHNPHSKRGHDVTQEGLHLDLIDPDGTKYKVRRGFPNKPINDYPKHCELYLLDKSRRLTLDFERRNNLSGKYYSP